MTDKGYPDKWKYQSIRLFITDRTIKDYFTTERFDTVIKAIKEVGADKYKDLIKKLADADTQLLRFSHLPSCKTKKELSYASAGNEYEQCKCQKDKPVHWLRALASYMVYPDNECFPDDIKELMSTFWQICHYKNLSKVDIFEWIEGENKKNEKMHQFSSLIYLIISGVQDISYTEARMHFLIDFIKDYSNRVKTYDKSKYAVYEEILPQLGKYVGAVMEMWAVVIKIMASIEIDAEEWYIR